MRIIKLVIIAVVMLGGLVTLIGLLMPSRVMVARTVLIDASPKQVFSTINQLQTWHLWFGPLMNDTVDTVNPASGKLKWVTGGKENILLLKDTSAGFSHFILTRKGQNPVNIFFSADSIEVVRSLQLEMRVVRDLKWYPWEKFSGMLEDHVTGPAYEATLKSLKAYIEKR